MIRKKRYEDSCVAIIKVEPHVRTLLKENAKKSQRYSDYIMELLKFKLETEKHGS